MKESDIMQTEPNSSRPAEGEVDLLDILRTVWNGRITIAGCALATGILGAVISLVMPKTWESKALLVPTETTQMNQLGAATALLGRRAMMQPDVELYRNLLTSRTVLSRLLDASLPDLSDTGRGVHRPFWTYLMPQDSVLTRLDREVLVSDLQEKVHVGTPPAGDGGIIEVTALQREPWLAKLVVDSVIAIGQVELRRVRNQRTEVILERLGAAVKESAAEWDSAARRVSAFREVNRSALLPFQQLRLDRLMLDRQAKEQKYLIARREYEQVMLEQAKATPAMVVLDPGHLPEHRSSPQRKKMVMIAIVLGGLLGGSLVLGKNLIRLVRRGAV